MRRAPNKLLPPQSHLLACFAYDAAAGTLTWRRRPREHFANRQAWLSWNTKYVGTIAGHVHPKGYRRVMVDGVYYWAQRIIWKTMTGEEPPETIDHINRNRGDNRWTNLRTATRAEQMWNRHYRGELRPDCADQKKRRAAVDRNLWYAGGSQRRL